MRAGASGWTESPRSSGRSIWAVQTTLSRLSLEALSLQVPQPMEAIVAEFGALAALYDLAQRLALVAHIDRHVPKRGKGPSVSTYILVAALNRCVAPRSKAAIAEWFQGTVLRRLVGVEPMGLAARRDWSVQIAARTRKCNS